MRSLRCVLMTVLLAMCGLASGPVLAESLNGSSQHLMMTLVAESDHPKAGAPLTIALATTPEKGWHGYWRNPGDAGFPATFDWTLPAGAKAGDAEWPVPTTLLIAGLMNYVYEAPYAPLVTIQVPAGLAAGTKFPIRLKTGYLVCSATICVPEEKALSLDLTIGDGAPSQAAAFAGWRQAIPKPLDAGATYAASNGTMRIAIPFPASAKADKAYFFPVTTGAIENGAAQTVTRDGDRLTISTKVAANAKLGGPIEGVLRIGDGQGLSVKATSGVVAEVAGTDAATSANGESLWLTALVAFAGAVLGGLILNIMPCVFPILSLKALSLARGGASEKDARGEALAYTAGVVLVCLGLGAAILALRAGGSAVGWAFQLQHPAAIVVLLLLSAAIAFNLAGLFEVPTPRFAGESGASGAFATGALAAFIATPCTGPFMGAALGAALVLPWPAALAVFGGLGIGLSLPFLAIGFIPSWRRWLPKPGVWMETFRHILSVPMFLTAIALGWVLGRQTGVDTLTLALIAVLAVGVVLWIGGTRQRKGKAFGVVAQALLLAVFVGSAVLIARAPPVSAKVATSGDEAFTEARLASLRAEKRPVFVYFTADWCLTCKVNEKAAIDTAGVRDAFAKNKVAALIGDWTDGNPVMGRFIQAHNRAGVPLYLYYAPGAAEPTVLPQVLTPALLEGLGA
ncbi:protein-disulfide reductase DsbD family protein [Sphingomonas sp. Leaf38]|uniref:protein-disulfide reductase DsbD family protein n=1 Tax=Sphingomonas sp. Leaf38 TaxID=1736217 RepID=UPI001910C4AD|nr:protein-disulfide reductase DsbD domain-containing protein [Sphingomonas sp. Leaf38]